MSATSDSRLRGDRDTLNRMGAARLIADMKAYWHKAGRHPQFFLEPISGTSHERAAVAIRSTIDPSWQPPAAVTTPFKDKDHGK